MQRRRKEFEEAFVSANSDLGEGGRLAPGDVAPEDFDVFVSESLKHVRNCDFHVKEDNRDIDNVMAVTLDTAGVQEHQQQIGSQGPERKRKASRQPTGQKCVCPSVES